jgi:hypothetical protein
VRAPSCCQQQRGIAGRPLNNAIELIDRQRHHNHFLDSAESVRAIMDLMTGIDIDVRFGRQGPTTPSMTR